MATDEKICCLGSTIQDSRNLLSEQHYSDEKMATAP